MYFFSAILRIQDHVDSTTFQFLTIINRLATWPQSATSAVSAYVTKQSSNVYTFDYSESKAKVRKRIQLS